MSNDDNAISREMLADAAKLWLAHDGLWFQEVERELGMEKAIEMDRNAWERFTRIEAKRIKQRQNIPENGGLEALKKALQYRLYAYINVQDIVEETEDSFLFRMIDCRVQSARHRKGLPAFPCGSVGIVEYSEFAKTIDPRIETEKVHCPPDEKHPNYWCAWRFTLKK